MSNLPCQYIDVINPVLETQALWQISSMWRGLQTHTFLLFVSFKHSHHLGKCIQEPENTEQYSTLVTVV